MPKRTEANRKTNIGVARAVPLLILGAIGYASWVLTKLICADYLISPPASPTARPRTGPAAAILVTYYLLLVITIVSYGRLLDTVARKPGLIPRGTQWYVERSKGRRGRDRSHHRRSESRSEDEKSTESGVTESKTPAEVRYLASERLPFKVEDFWHRDVFVCNPDGRPAFCSTCCQWKPDRSHHCSELNRCILKFDHFCPWVGGVVSETSFKYFIQFTFYAAFYTLEILVVVAYYFAERNRDSGFLNAHWIVLLALAALFFLFSGGMCMSTCHFAFINSTTIENLSRKSKVWCLAVYANAAVLEEAHEKGIALQLISYPRPAAEQLSMFNQRESGMSDHERVQAQSPTSQSTSYRTFVILESDPGANPFDLGPLNNFQEIMGLTIWEWLSPAEPSPCLAHKDPVSLYKLGPVVEEMKARTGLTSWLTQSERRRRRKRHQASDESTTHSADRS